MTESTKGFPNYDYFDFHLPCSVLASERFAARELSHFSCYGRSGPLAPSSANRTLTPSLSHTRSDGNASYELSSHTDSFSQQCFGPFEGTLESFCFVRYSLESELFARLAKCVDGFCHPSCSSFAFGQVK